MRLSVCLMVKNEERYLAECLEALWPIREALNTEVIVVDTGSEDNTVEIARKYTDKVYFHPWNNHFAEMRNTTISYAGGEWVLILDADEIMQNAEELIVFLRSDKRKSYAAACITLRNVILSEDKNAYSQTKLPRLFKRAGFLYQGTIHEQPVIQGEIVDLQTEVIHYGYMSSDVELMERKFKRSKEMLLTELDKDPENVYYLHQLSTTYGMYRDFEGALEYALKAYEALLKMKNESILSNYMYVYANLMFYYHKNGNYKKTVEIGKEALRVKKRDYLDIYFFLGEASALLEKYEEAIQYYEQYLALMNNYNDYEKQRDYEIVDQSAGQRDAVYMNLFTCCRIVGQDEKACMYGNKVKAKEYIRGMLPKWIPLMLKLGRYEELKQYYETRILGKNEELADLQDVFKSTLEDARAKLEEGEILKIAACFAEKVKDQRDREDRSDDQGGISDQVAIDYYELYNRLILEEHAGGIAQETVDILRQIDFSSLPVYCGGIFYYLLKRKYPLTDILTNFREFWLECSFDYLTEHYDDFASKATEYLQSEGQGPDSRSPEKISAYKLNKLLGRYALQSDTLRDDQYLVIFEAYINNGISYLAGVYQPEILSKEEIYDLKNEEEIFFLYMYKARAFQEREQAEYIKYLRLALQVLPGMSRGVEILLRQFEESRLTDTERELRGYQRQIKTKIEELIKSGDFGQAKYLIAEYEQIFAHDPDIYALKELMSGADSSLAESAGRYH